MYKNNIREALSLKSIESENYLTEAKQSVLFMANRPQVVMEYGRGMYIWDTEGKAYLDFVGGWAVNCLGHCPEVIREALNKQSGILINASPSFYNKPMLQFAKLLTDNSCFDRVFFSSTGAEANEGAIKLARKHGNKHLNGAYEIITTINGFHGRTLATMSATGKKTWEDLFKPKVPGFKHVPLNDTDAAISAVDEKTCGIMLELIQGEGGVNEGTVEYVQALRQICDERGILLIVDEIQTGLGRTGKLFAYEHYNIEPDIMTLAKGIGGGYPLSALLTKEKYNIFDQGGTYCAQPLGMAVLEEILKEKLCDNAAYQGGYIIECLQGISGRFKLKNIRGKGLLIAFDLPGHNAQQVVNQCLKEGLLINSPQPSVIRLMPPLIVSKDDTDKMISIISDVLAKM
jgi:acetylornithine/N-succinyldiaminopimelate aminotransferase